MVRWVRTYLTMVTGSILSEAHAVYGLALTLLQDRYSTGSDSVWSLGLLFWVRGRFKQNLGELPDTQT